MEITNNRHLAILYYFLSMNKVATSEQLSEFTSSSVRTIKSDIVKLNSLLEVKGICRIDSTKSKGYILVIQDETMMENFSNRIKSEYSFYKNESLEKISRRIYITQRILSSENVKIDDLADELYLTRSAIKDDLVWVTDFFKSYDIDLVSKPSKGLSYKGYEENIRSIMIEAFCSQYHDLQDIYLVKEFNNIFYQSIDYYKDIRHRFLKLIRESNYSMKDINTKKFATYIVLIKNRIKNNNTVKIKERVKKEIQHTYELSLAKKIIRIPGLYEDVEISEDELYVLAKKLLCYRDIDIVDVKDIKTIKPIFIKEISDKYEMILKLLSNKFGNSLFKLELFSRYRNSMISYLYSFYMLKKFDSNYKRVLTTYYEVANFEFSPITIEMARNFLVAASKVFETDLDSCMANRYIILLELILKKINYSYKKRRIAVLSVAGRATAREYRDRFIEEFGDFIEYIHIFNQYEMRRVNFYDYDIAISDSESIFNYYPIEIVNSNLLNIDDPTIPIFKRVFLKGYSKNQIDKLIDITTSYDSFECANYSILFKMLSYKFAINNSKEFEEKLLVGEKNFSYFNPNNGTAFIMCDYRLTNKEFIEIYFSDNKMMWDSQKEVKYIIVASFNNNTNIVDLKVTNKILQVLYNRPKYISELILNKEETYNEIYNKIITNNFIRN